MFLLQQGWGMLNQIESFLINHPNSGIIFSPRICEKEQLERYWPQFINIPNSELFFEPYFYEPRTDLARVLSYPYFKNFDFDTNKFKMDKFCKSVIEYQINNLGLNNIILPGRYTNSLSENWLNTHYKFAQIGSNYSSDKNRIFSSIVLGPDVILNLEQYNSIIDEIVNYPTDGIYFIFEHPDNSYFLDEEFLYILLDSLLSVSLSNKKIILGYANQQLIALAASGTDYIASGNYRNVRVFDHLNTKDRDDDNLRKGIWYFDGNTFGEYKIAALSLAFRRNLRNYFGPITEFTEELLNSDRPTSIAWPERFSFLHYLHLMYIYIKQVYSIPKNKRVNYLIEFFKEIKNNNDKLQNAGFNFGDRGFNLHVNSTLSALELFHKDRKIDIESLV
ncbi:MAG: hypothetical protein Kow0037_11630 [Calditrichia bacterium]